MTPTRPEWAVVIPAAPASPHLNALFASLHSEAPPLVLVVSEEPAALGVHVPVASEASFAARANRGLEFAFERGCQSVVLLNDDTAVRPGACAALIEAVAAPGVGIAGAVLLDWNSDSIQAAGLHIHRPSGRVRLNTNPPPMDTHSTEVFVDAVSGAAMAVDRSCWEQTGGFDHRYSFYFEDLDLCLRAQDKGFAVALVPAAQVNHQGGGSLPATSRRAAALLGRNHLLFAHSLGGSSLRRWARSVAVGLFGMAWTLKSQGPAGIPAFLGGLFEGIRTATSRRTPPTPAPTTAA